MSEARMGPAAMKLLARFRQDRLLGVRFAVNVFVGGSAVWLLLQFLADIDPIWAIASMIAASEPVVKDAVQMFRAQIINVLVGCLIGVAVLVIGGASPWKVPLAISMAVLVSSYFVRVHTMWRQAPITAALVIAAALTAHSPLSGIQHGLYRVGEVILGCLIGLLVTWLLSHVWPMPGVQAKAEASPAKA